VPTSTSLTVPASPLALFAPIELNAAVSPDPGGGWVNFFVDDLNRASGEIGAGGVASATLPFVLGPGTHSFFARFLGNPTNSGSDSPTKTITIVDDRTPVTVTLDVVGPNPSHRGDPVELHVVVSPDPQDGYIQIYDGTQGLIGGSLSSQGTIDLVPTFTTSGTHPLQACYEGNRNYGQGCSAVVDQVVSFAPTTTTLTIDPATVYPGEAFTIGVTVTPAPRTEVAGWVGVNVYDHKVWVAIQPVTGHGEVTVAAEMLRDWTIGTYDLYAFFPRTDDLDASSSDVVRLTIRLDPATLDVTTSPEPTTVGDPLTFSATVTPIPSEPTAGVAFRVTGPAASGFGDTVGFTLAADGTGRTTVDTDGWPAGDFWYDATFGGDPHLETVVVRGYFTLVDVDAPAGGVTVADGIDTVISDAVTVDVPATDGSGSGVQVVALSNDGTLWTEMAYTPKVSWNLATGDGTRSVLAKWRDQAGNWSSIVSDSVVVKSTAATVSTPKSTLAVGAAINAGRVAIRIMWTAGSGAVGVVDYGLEQSTDGGVWVPVASGLVTTLATHYLAPGHLYRFRVRAVDYAGNVGTWMYGPTFRLTGVQQSSSAVHYHGTWSTSTSTTWWGGTARSSSTRGSTVSYTSTGRSIAWVGLKAYNRGKAQVYVNGVLKATVDLYSATALKQRIVWAASYSTSATRTITIKVLGASGRPRVDVDGFIVGS
jgi:hypothetical protein